MAVDTIEISSGAQSDEFLTAAADMNNLGAYTASTIYQTQNIQGTGISPVNRVSNYLVFERYYDGDQRTKLDNRTREYLMLSGFPFCENVCDTVVDVMAERLCINQWDAKPDDAPWLGAVQQGMEDIWDFNCGDDLQDVVHTEALKKGDAWVILDWDADEAMPVMCFNRAEMCKIIYDPGNYRRALYAVKVWETNEAALTNPNSAPIDRMNVYFPDRIEKYFKATKGDAGWTPHADIGDAAWPVEWVRPDGTPRGIPVFHWRNKARGHAYGRSEIRKLIPMQDQYNKHIIDLAVVTDYQGYPQRWAKGINAEDAGQLVAHPGSIFTMGNGEGEFGQFDPAPISPMVQLIESDIQRAAGLTRTPLYALLIAGNVPSGEALKTAESGLTSKVRNRWPSFGNEWEKAMRMAVLMLHDYAGLPDGENDAGPDDATGYSTMEPADPEIPQGDEQGMRIQVIWKDPETRNENDFINSLIAKRTLGVPTKQLLTELGYENVDEMLEQAQREKQAAVDAQMRAFGAGAVPGGSPDDSGQGGSPTPATTGTGADNAQVTVTA